MFIDFFTLVTCRLISNVAVVLWILTLHISEFICKLPKIQFMLLINFLFIVSTCIMFGISINISVIFIVHCLGLIVLFSPLQT